MNETWDALRNTRLGHRCYQNELAGTVRYDPVRPHGRSKPWTAVVELPDDFAQSARADLERRHGIVLNPPEFGFHVTIFSGAHELTPALERSWGAFEASRARVLLTHELFWKGRFVWANVYCPERDMMRMVAGLDDADPELWGHATVGCFPDGFDMPRFLDYRDFPDWGFRP